MKELPNGWRYRLVGGTRRRHFDGISSKPRKLLENAKSPTSRVHAVLAVLEVAAELLFSEKHSNTPLV